MSRKTPGVAPPLIDPGILAARHLSALAKGKAHYKKSDAALDALLKQKKAGDIVILPDGHPTPAALRGKKFIVVDKFENRNSIGVGLSARRFEMEELTEP